MSPGSSPSSASSSSSPFSSSWIISKFKNSQSPNVVFDPSSHLTLPGPEEVLDVDVRVQSRQVGVSIPDDQNFQLWFFNYVLHYMFGTKSVHLQILLVFVFIFIENGLNFFLLLIFSHFLTQELAQWQLVQALDWVFLSIWFWEVNLFGFFEMIHISMALPKRGCKYKLRSVLK